MNNDTRQWVQTGDSTKYIVHHTPPTLGDTMLLETAIASPDHKTCKVEDQPWLVVRKVMMSRRSVDLSQSTDW